MILILHSYKVATFGMEIIILMIFICEIKLLKALLVYWENERYNSPGFIGFGSKKALNVLKFHIEALKNFSEMTDTG